MARLKGVDLKIGRAQEHLAFLERERGRFLEGIDRSVVGHFEPEERDYVFRVASEPPPFEWGLIVGEVVHNLRSALDQMLWQLVLVRGGTPTNRTMFPIYKDPAKFKRKAHRLTAGVLTEDRAFIKSVQPFEEGRNWAMIFHPLNVLGHLNNVDKHRFLVPGFATMLMEFRQRPGERRMPGRDGVRGAQVQGWLGGTTLVYEDGSSVFMSPPLPFDVVDVFMSYMGIGNPDDRAEVLRLRITDPEWEYREMRMEPSPTVDVGFSDGERRFALEDLDGAVTKVISVIEHFRPVID